MKIVGLALRYWKYIALALAIGAAFFSFKAWVADQRTIAYNAGASDTKNHYEELISKEDRDNREREKVLQDRLNDYALRFVEQSNQRVEKEKVLTNTVREIVKADPIYQDCKVSDEVLLHINSIRSGK